MSIQYDDLAGIWADRLWQRDQAAIMGLDGYVSISDYIEGQLAFMEPEHAMVASITSRLFRKWQDEKARHQRPADDQRAAARARVRRH